MNDLSVWRLFLEATVVVQLVMLLLLAASVYAWAVVFRTRAVLRRARDTLARFEREFWSGGDLGTLYRSIESRGDANGIYEPFMRADDFVPHFGDRQRAQVCVVVPGMVADLVTIAGQGGQPVAGVRVFEVPADGVHRVFEPELPAQFDKPIHHLTVSRVDIVRRVAGGLCHGVQMQRDGRIASCYSHKDLSSRR